MKSTSKNDFHELFRISILVKAADGFIEMCAGTFFYFVNYTAVSAILFSVFHEEVTESPRDAIWAYAIKEWHSLALSGHTFWGLLFMAHGATKFLLSVALLKNKLWAYPVAMIVFSVFVLYESYSLTNRPSVFLLLITIFDMITVGLIINEFLQAKKHRIS